MDPQKEEQQHKQDLIRTAKSHQAQAQILHDKRKRGGVYKFSLSDRWITKDGTVSIIEVIDSEPLICGDQVFYNGAFGLKEAEHHGIYLGDGIIAEAWLDSKTSGFQDALTSSSFRFGIVDSRTVEQFTDSGAKVLRKIVYDPSPSSEERMSSCQRAIDMFGEIGYNLFRANCEHFACRMVTGTGESQQIKRITDKLAIPSKICQSIEHIRNVNFAETMIADISRVKDDDIPLGLLISIADRYGVKTDLPREQMLYALRRKMVKHSIGLAVAVKDLGGMVADTFAPHPPKPEKRMRRVVSTDDSLSTHSSEKAEKRRK